jgi:tetratricopeptide (TPR) repeat protein
MRLFSGSRACLNPSVLSLALASRFILILLVPGAAILTLSGSATAQSGPGTTAASPLCSRDNALEIIRQQLDASKTFDDSVRRITVLIRAADLLWPDQQEKARAAFTEAFELATQNFKEKGDEPKREGRALMIEIPDQRYTVIRAVSKRDPAWAKKLTGEMLKKDRQEAEEATTKNPETDIRTADKLLESASSLLSSDLNAALNFATTSLSYPASMRLTMFLYKLAEVNQKAADQFYQQALAVYSDKPMREFLYLAAYPFGFDNPGDMPFTGSYIVPTAFFPNLSLQRLFVQTLLRRAQQALQIPLDEGDNYNEFPGMGHILQVLTLVEPQVRKHQPDLIGAMEQARNNLLVTLSPQAQSIFLRPTGHQDSAAGKTFDEQIEAAEKSPEVNRRDELVVTAILNASQTESVEHVVNTADKIADANVRPQVLDWFYFDRTQSAVKDKRLDEATRLASKVRELDQRAYLYSEIARESLQRIEDQNQARELLEEIVTTATKGPSTLTAARALLSAAYLYLKIDPNRSISVLSDAVKLINRIESPDFSRQFLLRKIEGKNFARYAAFKIPGFSPESAFREMAKTDFDSALAQVNGFTDKSLRALVTLVLADYCLQRAEQQEKLEKAKKKVKL